MRRWLIWTTIATLSTAGLVAACTTKTGPVGSTASSLKDRVLALANTSYQKSNQKHHVHKDALMTNTRLKLKVVNFDGDAGLPMMGTKADDAGAFHDAFTCDAAYGDEAPHPITITETVYPPMSDHPDESVIVDQATGNRRTFTADHEFMRFTVGDGTSTLTIVTNPDGTYTIDGKPAATDAEAAKLIIASPVGKSTSIEGLAVLLAGLTQREQNLKAQTLGAVQMSAEPTNNGEPGDPVSLVEACIEALEKDPATPAPVPAAAATTVSVHGTVHDDKDERLANSSATVEVKLLNGATFPDGSTSRPIQPIGLGFGMWAVNQVPVGATVQVTASADGYVTQTRTIVAKANVEGDPMANRLDFGGYYEKGKGLKAATP